jgi:hypothetical protein
MLTPSSLAAPIKSRKIKRGKGGEGRGTGCHRLRWLGYYSHPHDIHKPLRVFTIGLTLTTTSRPRSRCSNRFRGQNKSESPESGSATKDRAREAKCYANLSLWWRAFFLPISLLMLVAHLNIKCVQSSLR